MDPKNAKTIATACCVLHNILRLWTELGEAITPVPPNGALLEGVDEVGDISASTTGLVYWSSKVLGISLQWTCGSRGFASVPYYSPG